MDSSSSNGVLQLLEEGSGDTLKNGVCRACLGTCEGSNEYLLNIFDCCINCDGVYKPIATVFETYFSQKIEPGDGYPEVICSNCLDKAVRAIEFKDKFQKFNTVETTEEILPNSESDEGIIIIVESDNGDLTQYLCQGIKEEAREEIVKKNILPISQETFADTMYFCQNCGIPFFTKEALSDHMVSCLRCELCQATHTNILDLKVHKDVHKKTQETLCPDCGSLLKRGYHSLDNFKYPCKQCNFIFPCTSYLDQHVEFDHKKKVKCVETLKDINRNIVSLHDVGRFMCRLCNKTFATVSNANSHALSMSCLYVCDICNVNYKLKSQLKIHMMDKHLGIKPYLCSVCGKSFVRKGMLKSHYQTHSQTKPYECNVCGKKFVSAATLRYHSRLHTGEKPYICSLCGERFVKCSRLREHEQKWHIGKLQCPKCMTTFSQRCSLKTHMDRFHPNTYDKKVDYLLKEVEVADTYVLNHSVVESNEIIIPELTTMYTLHITE